MNELRPAIVDRRIRFALVGCGRIAARHIEALARHRDNAELVAVCDNDEAALRSAVETTRCDGYASLSSLLRETSADAVILCTPSGLHPAQTMQVARSGRHVVTEKPMATRWTDGVEMVRACDEADVRLFVVKQNRRNATLQLLKRALERKRFGRIFMVTINVFWTRPQEYFSSAKWRGTWEFDGGALMNQASHYIDLVDWLVGPVESVQAYIATLARDIQVEDTATVGVRWRSGTLGSINVTMLTYPQNLEGSITILGERGTVRVGGVAVNRIDEWRFADEHPDDAQIANVSYQTGSVYGFGHGGYYENVIETLRGRCDAETDGREGLKSLEILIASYMSARDGHRVALPLQY
jgi:UDP-N-acetyl-2-amino-2-deoxyglucuronate dehydrogenase